mmetsp:Transcript_8974/g.8561  ORF Transcript_8974/g.8561 Transcript_8974/m.8561 type:complete len:95 (-) Transcript_8974:326-610(-)
MSVNSILGLPIIVEGILEPRWKKKLNLSHTLSTKFPTYFMQKKRATIPDSTVPVGSNTASTTLVMFSPNNASAQFRSAVSDASAVNVDEAAPNE